jgi:hypothetical protein
VSIHGETARRGSPNITETEDANSHSLVLVRHKCRLPAGVLAFTPKRMAR